MEGTNSGAESNVAAPAARATYQDVLDAPEHVVAEIIGGTLYTHPRPAPRHATASSVLGGKLGAAFHWGEGGPGGWRILDEPELHLGEEILVPDLAGWRRERMPELPDTAYFTLAPDWACEVLSASTRKLDLVRKRPIYAREGIPHLWLVDPSGTHPGGVRTARRAMGSDRERGRRRAGEHRAVRSSHIQSGRALGLNRHSAWLTACPRRTGRRRPSALPNPPAGGAHGPGMA